MTRMRGHRVPFGSLCLKMKQLVLPRSEIGRFLGQLRATECSIEADTERERKNKVKERKREREEGRGKEEVKKKEKRRFTVRIETIRDHGGPAIRFHHESRDLGSSKVLEISMVAPNVRTRQDTSIFFRKRRLFVIVRKKSHYKRPVLRNETRSASCGGSTGHRTIRRGQLVALRGCCSFVSGSR